MNSKSSVPSWSFLCLCFWWWNQGKIRPPPRNSVFWPASCKACKPLTSLQASSSLQASCKLVSLLAWAWTFASLQFSIRRLASLYTIKSITRLAKTNWACETKRQLCSHWFDNIQDPQNVFNNTHQHIRKFISNNKNNKKSNFRAHKNRKKKILQKTTIGKEIFRENENRKKKSF